MPHAHTLYINKSEEHLSELTKLKFKNRNYETTRAIKNGFLFNTDFLHSTYLEDHRNRNHLTPQWSLCTPLFYGVPKIYIPYVLLLKPPPPPPPATKTSMYLSFLWPLQSLYTVHFPFLYPFHPVLLSCNNPTNQFSNYVTHYM